MKWTTFVDLIDMELRIFVWSGIDIWEQFVRYKYKVINVYQL